MNYANVARHSVDDIIYNCGFFYAPVNMLFLATKLGIKVFESEISYKSCIRYKDGPQIHLSYNLPHSKDRLFLAYQIAFIILFNNKSNNINKLDNEQVNNLAIQLLLPERLVRQTIGYGKITSLKKLADIFQVNEYIIELRLKAIGLLL